MEFRSKKSVAEAFVCNKWCYFIFRWRCKCFFPLNEKSISLSFFSSLLLLGALFYSKFNIEKNTISFFACFSAVILVVCAIGMILFADSIDDSVYACVTLTGSVMILSTPFEKPYEKAKKH